MLNRYLCFKKIYTISLSFRAEKSKTSRHRTEYWHAEMEMAWSTSKTSKIAVKLIAYGKAV